MLLDLTDLAGRTFVAPSGRTAVVRLLGEHGASIRWDHRETATDHEEFRRWVAKQLRIPIETLDVTEVDSGRASETLPIEHALYRRFLEDNRDEPRPAPDPAPQNTEQEKTNNEHQRRTRHRAHARNFRPRHSR